MYQSYFVILQQQFTRQELQFIVHLLKVQANEILRMKPMFITMSGAILFVFTFIATAINSKVMMDMSLVQIVALAVLSFHIAIIWISFKIEIEHKRVQAVIALLDYYVTIVSEGVTFMQKTADRFHDWLIKVSEIIHVMMERFLQLQYEAFPYVVTTYDQVQWVAYH